METQLILLISVLILVAAIASERLKKSVVTPPMLFVCIGYLFNGLLDMPSESTVVRLTVELTLIMILFTDGQKICSKEVWKTLPITGRLLGIGMPLSVLFGAFVGYALFPEWGIWQGALLAAVLTPTDAALCHVALHHKEIPREARESLTIESGLNDGLILPVILFLIVCNSLAEGQEYWSFWIKYFIQQVAVALAIGVGVGRIGSEIIHWTTQKKTMNHIFQHLSALSFALLSFSLAESLGGNGLIAAFVAGITFGKCLCIGNKDVTEFTEAQSELLALLSFTLFGAIMVPVALDMLNWQIVVYALLALTIIRMAAVGISLIGMGFPLHRTLFYGWMGPRGMASLLFGLIVLETHSIPFREEIFQVVSLTVLMSIFVHGISSRYVSRFVPQ